jgi:hypothetical protein
MHKALHRVVPEHEAASLDQILVDARGIAPEPEAGNLKIPWIAYEVEGMDTTGVLVYRVCVLNDGNCVIVLGAQRFDARRMFSHWSALGNLRKSDAQAVSFCLCGHC